MSHCLRCLHYTADVGYHSDHEGERWEDRGTEGQKDRAACKDVVRGRVDMLDGVRCLCVCEAVGKELGRRRGETDRNEEREEERESCKQKLN